ncbi:MAG: TetR-like C-terminal domain-containing protein [Bacteroidia bacterium]
MGHRKWLGQGVHPRHRQGDFLLSAGHLSAFSRRQKRTASHPAKRWLRPSSWLHRKAQLSASQAELQLVNISTAYWRFADDYAELYQVMFNLEGVFVDSQTTTAELRRASQPVIGILKALAPEADQEEVFYHWWSTVHGYISLMMSQQLAAYDTDKREAYLRKAITRIVVGLKHG